MDTAFKDNPLFSPLGNKCLRYAIELAKNDENLIEGAVLKATRCVQSVVEQRQMRRNFPSIILSGILKGRQLRADALKQQQIADLFQQGDVRWPAERRKSVVLQASAYSDNRHYKKRLRSDG